MRYIIYQEIIIIFYVHGRILEFDLLLSKLYYILLGLGLKVWRIFVLRLNLVLLINSMRIILIDGEIEELFFLLKFLVKLLINLINLELVKNKSSNLIITVH
jgi:hypothetical protein